MSDPTSDPTPGPASGPAANRRELSLVAPARIEVIDQAHALIEQLWDDPAAPSPTDRIRFEMAVIEILGNIVEHAAQVDPPDVAARQVELTVSCDEEMIEARFGDDGKPVEIDLADVTMPDQLDAEDGRGLALAIAAVDEVTYERIGPSNRWTLRCRRS